MTCETCGALIPEGAALCENCGEPAFAQGNAGGGPAVFLTGGRSAKRTISDLVPGEVLKALLRPMPPRPHAAVTISTWVERGMWPDARRGFAEAAPSSPQVENGGDGGSAVGIDAEPVIDNSLLVDEPSDISSAPRISDLAPGEVSSRIHSTPLRPWTTGTTIGALGE